MFLTCGDKYERSLAEWWLGTFLPARMVTRTGDGLTLHATLPASADVSKVADEWRTLRQLWAVRARFALERTRQALTHYRRFAASKGKEGRYGGV